MRRVARGGLGDVDGQIAHALEMCWGFSYCVDYDSYGESGSTQTSATPAVAPEVLGVTPTSGAGPSQTFTFTYRSVAGASDINHAVQVFVRPWGMANACVTFVVRATGEIQLWNDAATAPLMSAPAGHGAILENSQCRVHTGGASVSSAGATVTMVLPIEFKTGYYGPKDVYTWVVSVAGVYSAGVDVGDWTARARIDGVNPGSAVVGQTVTVTGQGFGTAGSLTFNQTPATPTQWSPTSITATVPAGATSGPVAVWTAGQASNGVGFTVVTGPEISGLSPTWGPVGTPVVISGVNFGATKGSSTVKFNGKTASTSAWSDTSLTATVPSGATSGLVVVTRSGMPPSPGVPFTVGAEEVVYYTTDGIGSVRMITTFGQHVVSRHDYLPFGGEWQPGLSHPQPLGFAGGEWDWETGSGSSQGLTYFGARHLHSATGRFMSVDPIRMTSKRLLDPQLQNLFSYARNNPLRFVDPDGRYAVDCSNADAKCWLEWMQFERALDDARRSKDRRVRDAADAYGTLGDGNGVFVHFNYEGHGVVNFDGSMPNRPNVHVWLNPHLERQEFLQTVVHEGVHVSDALRFINSGFDHKYNYTFGDTEARAFQAGAVIMPYTITSNCNVAECSWKFGPTDTATIRQFLQKSDVYRVNYESWVFPR